MFAKLPNFTKISASLFTIFALSACVPQQDTLPIEEQVENLDEETTAIVPPRITMGLPITLSSIVDDTNNKMNKKVSTRESEQNTDHCQAHFDRHANFMENGYSMSRFLVGLSQSQSCFADFIMSSIVAQGQTNVNRGLISLPPDPNDTESPSHLQITHNDDTTKVWLYFYRDAESLPADKSNLHSLHLSWTENTDGGITGQFFMVNMPQHVEDPDAPENIRVDFFRTATTATNKIYLKLRDSHSGSMEGFRIDVNRTGVDQEAIYTAKGLIAFSEQPFPGLPPGNELPEFAAAAVVDAEGLGATSANFNKFAISLTIDSNNDGVVDPTVQEFELGAYQFDINDTTYFDPALYDATDVNTPFVEQVIEWRNKSAGNATYIAEYPRVEPTVLPILSNYTMFKCMEREFCDYNGNGVLDENSGEWEGWNLGEGYFTDVCIDDATTANNNCDAFVNKFFEDNMFGVASLNSTTTEPTDWRNTELTNLTQLTSVHPEADPTGETTFDVPNPSTM